MGRNLGKALQPRTYPGKANRSSSETMVEDRGAFRFGMSRTLLLRESGRLLTVCHPSLGRQPAKNGKNLPSRWKVFVVDGSGFFETQKALWRSWQGAWFGSGEQFLVGIIHAPENQMQSSTSVGKKQKKKKKKKKKKKNGRLLKKEKGHFTPVKRRRGQLY